MTRGPLLPPNVFRSGQTPIYGCYVCHECGTTDAPALVEFYGVEVAASDGNYDGEHLVCALCMQKAVGLLFDPSLVETKTPLVSEKEKLAREFATKAHGDQKYDSGNSPYVLHLAAVRDVLVEFGWTKEDELVSAWLHDVLEDTEETKESVEAVFGRSVMQAVWAVTGVGKNRRERNDDAGKKMIDFPPAISLKLADRLANGRASKKTSPDKLFKMYREEHPSFKAKLYATCPKDPRALAMWVALEKLFVEET